MLKDRQTDNDDLQLTGLQFPVGSFLEKAEQNGGRFRIGASIPERQCMILHLHREFPKYLTLVTCPFHAHDQYPNTRQYSGFVLLYVVENQGTQEWRF